MSLVMRKPNKDTEQLRSIEVSLAGYLERGYMSLVMRKLAFCICENNDAE